MISKAFAVLFVFMALHDTLASSQDVARNCEEWRVRGVVDRTYYTIDPDQDGPLAPFQVRCDMTRTPAFDVVEHNYLQRTENVKAPHPKGLGYTVTYHNATMEQITTLVDTAASCYQHLKYECHGSLITYQGKQDAAWYSRDNTRMPYWPGGPPSGRGCACGMNRSCAGGAAHFCNCEKNDNVWRSDEGNVTDKGVLPITKLNLTDTDDNGERGFFTLGPLRCQGKTLDKARKIIFSDSCRDKSRGNQDLMMLNMGRGSKPCVGWPGENKWNTSSYDLSFSMIADMTTADGAGNPGVAFNMRDQHNYDLVFFRLHSTKDCYEYGYMEEGKYHYVLTGSCASIFRPSYHKWFSVKVEVRSTRANVYLNGDFLMEVNTHHEVATQGGVLALNGHNFLLLATDYRLTAAQGTSGTASVPARPHPEAN